MSVTKYRDVAEMPPLPLVSGPELAQRIRSVWARARRLARACRAPGVQRFASIEEAQQAREEATRARMQQLRSERLAGRTP